MPYRPHLPGDAPGMVFAAAAREAYVHAMDITVLVAAGVALRSARWCAGCPASGAAIDQEFEHVADAVAVTVTAGHRSGGGVGPPLPFAAGRSPSASALRHRGSYEDQ